MTAAVPPQPAAQELAERLRALLRDVPDFPKPGIVFKDIGPLLADHGAFVAAVDAVVDGYPAGSIDKVAGVEARGFLFAAPVAYHLGAGMVPVRKPGKLPGPVREAAYDLEYGTDRLQVHADAFGPGDRVLVVDDVLATGGTAGAAVRLVRESGAVPVGLAVLLELTALGGRERLRSAEPELTVQALLSA